MSEDLDNTANEQVSRTPPKTNLPRCLAVSMFFVAMIATYFCLGGSHDSVAKNAQSEWAIAFLFLGPVWGVTAFLLFFNLRKWRFVLAVAAWMLSALALGSLVTVVLQAKEASSRESFAFNAMFETLDRIKSYSNVWHKLPGKLSDVVTVKEGEEAPRHFDRMSQLEYSADKDGVITLRSPASSEENKTQRWPSCRWTLRCPMKQIGGEWTLGDFEFKKEEPRKE